MQLFKICLLLLTPLSLFAQNINIPDPNFKNTLLNTPCVDTNGDGIFESNADLNSDGEINLTEALAVTRLNIDSSEIDSLNGLEAFTNLVYLSCSFNDIPKLDFSPFMDLEYLDCGYNRFDTLDVRSLSKLTTLDCTGSFLAQLKADSLSHLKEIQMSYNRIREQIEFQGLANLEILNCSGNRNLRMSTKGLSSLKHLETSDCYLDNLYDLADAPNLEYLRCDKNELTELDITALTKLKYVNIDENFIPAIDVSNAPDLEVLICQRNELTELDVSGLLKLEEVFCDDNQISTLNLTGCIALKELGCARNVLTEIDFQDSKEIELVRCLSNNIFHIDAQGLDKLIYLRCRNNNLRTLNVRGCTSLIELSCWENNLTEIDVQDSYNLRRLHASINYIKYLLIKNGNALEDLSIQLDHLGAYVCCDTSELGLIMDLIEDNNYDNVHINEYCSFFEGGPLSEIQGEQVLDMDKNGCDSNDMRVQSPKLNISDGTSNAALAFPNNPIFLYALSPGSYQLSARFTHPNYFDIQPANYQIDLPASTPTAYDFCITPVGERHNVTIDFIPITTTQPGFVGDYQVVVTNIGNAIESGTVEFEYDEALLDFVSSSQAPTQQGNGLLEWNFSALQPFEKLVIDFSLQANTPMDVPPLNNEDVLLFVAHVEIPQDETPSNNTDVHREIVVGSYDPNDKTCLNGLSIDPDEVGDYLSYLIRFENTGTAPAQNVVVKDSIDPRTLDIATLEVINASHSVRTRIEDGTAIEFIFENIELPFVDATNDGFVAFKIKTKPNLILGDSIKNKAEIYFDFNFPIITNEAQTVVQETVVSVPKVSESAPSYTIAPNPVENHFFIKNADKASKIELYSMDGALIRAMVYEPKMDVSFLPSGFYQLKIYVDGEMYVRSFVKQ